MSPDKARFISFPAGEGCLEGVVEAPHTLLAGRDFAGSVTRFLIRASGTFFQEGRVALRPIPSFVEERS
jgi:hypothetical protein